MMRPNLGGPEIEALFVIIYYLSHFTLGSTKVYFPEAYAHREVSEMANITHGVRHRLCDKDGHESPNAGRSLG